MGVKELWSILASAKTQMPLSDLSGKVIAVDLSIWIVETQGVKQMQGTVTKAYLRNLFFRCSCLMQLGVKLVFVIEGDPPEIKWETMDKRQGSQWRGGRRGRGRGRGGGGGGAVRKKTRSHFKSILRECCEMLDYLGIPYVQSCGEAEGTCARLDALGLVDGCMTNDGDAFLYGARTVYRNFTMDRKEPHVECYTISDIKENTGLNQDSLIALAILLGCDYIPKGVPSIGKETAMKFMRTLAESSSSVLDKKWTSADYMDTLTDLPPDIRQAEINVRQKAIITEGFPFEKVILEFTCMMECSSLQLFLPKWKRPKMFHLQKFHASKLEWVEEYSLNKILPLVTLYDLTHLKENPAYVDKGKHLMPHRIHKARIRQGIPCYEINWNKVAGDDTTSQEYYTTIETQELFRCCFPSLVSDYEKLTLTPATQAKKKRAKKATPAVELEECPSATASKPDDTPIDDKNTDDDLVAQLESLSLLSNEHKHEKNKENEASKAKMKLNLEKEEIVVSSEDEEAEEFLPLSQRIQIRSSNAEEFMTKATVTAANRKSAEQEEDSFYSLAVDSDLLHSCSGAKTGNASPPNEACLARGGKHSQDDSHKVGLERINSLKDDTLPDLEHRSLSLSPEQVREVPEPVDMCSPVFLEDIDSGAKTNTKLARRTGAKNKVLSFLEKDDDSCLLVLPGSQCDDLEKQNVEPTYNRYVDIPPLSDFENEAYKTPSRLQTPSFCDSIGKRNTTGYSLSPLRDSQIGHFTIDFSLQSNISTVSTSAGQACDTPLDMKRVFVDQSPLVVGLDTPVECGDRAQASYKTSMSSTPLSNIVSAPLNLDSSFEDSPVCLSQRLAKRLGMPESKLLSSMK